MKGYSALICFIVTAIFGFWGFYESQSIGYAVQSSLQGGPSKTVIIAYTLAGVFCFVGLIFVKIILTEKMEEEGRIELLKRSQQ